MAIRKPWDDSPLCVERTINTKQSIDLYTGFITELRQKHIDDWDAVILITGDEGCGKSALGINLAVDLDTSVLTSMEKHVVWSGDDLNRLVFTSEPSAIVEDEAGIDLFSRDFASSGSKSLVKMVMVMRAQNHIPILILPNLGWLDTYLREHRVKYWIKVFTVKNGIKEERGFADLYIAKRGDFMKKTYWEKIFTFRFPDFPEEIAYEYKRGKKASMLERMLDSPIEERSKQIYNAFELERKGKKVLTQGEIGTIFGLTQQRISQTIKEVKTIRENMEEKT